MIRLLIALSLSVAFAGAACAQERRRVEIGVPKHYVVKTRCIPERGFIAEAEAANHPPALPMVNLLIFNGEVIGLSSRSSRATAGSPGTTNPKAGRSAMMGARNITAS